MNTVTYGGARVPRTAVSQRAKAKKRKRFFARFMDALTESRRQQARRMIEDHAYLLPNDPDSPVYSWFFAAALAASKAPIRCPITGYPCEGDISHLCEDYGCARKGGLSPCSDENL